MTDHARYRVEDGVHCVDIRIDSIEHMYDNRDPAPFRARDLDPDLVEYLVASAEDLAPLGPLKLVFWVTKDTSLQDVEPGYRAHLDYELDRMDRRIRRQRREAQVVLAIGTVALAALLSLGELASRMSGGALVAELLHLLSWVVMWRPIDMLVYQWLPLHRSRKLLRTLRAAPLEVRRSKPAAI